MANTTNYGWETPDDTDLVKDGAAAIRTLGSAVDTTTKALNPETTLGDIAYRSATANTNTRLAVGSNGQVLTVASGVPSWATPSDQTPLTTKGDLFTFSTSDARLPVGTNGYTLVADSAETTGLKWAAPAAGGGKVLQVLQDTQTGIVSTNGTTFVTTNCAQAITPSATSSKVLVNLTLTNVATTNGQRTVYVTLRRNGTDIADLGTSIGYTPGTTSYAYGGTISISYLDSPSTTSSTTYEAFFRSSTSGTTVYIGNYDGANTATSAIVVMEIGA